MIGKANKSEFKGLLSYHPYHNWLLQALLMDEHIRLHVLKALQAFQCQELKVHCQVINHKAKLCLDIAVLQAT